MFENKKSHQRYYKATLPIPYELQKVIEGLEAEIKKLEAERDKWMDLAMSAGEAHSRSNLDFVMAICKGEISINKKNEETTE